VTLVGRSPPVSPRLLAPGLRLRVLFVAEAVTLAQVTRLATLAEGLDADRYDVHFASAEFDELVFPTPLFVRWRIRSRSKSQVDAAVASGRRPYDEATLVGYVEEDLRLLDAVRPDVVIGDLRLSLPTSAAVAGVPLLSLANAYWSPHAVRDRFPMPDHPIVKLLGPRFAERYFPIALPRVFEHFAAPVNAVRRRYGLGRIGSLPEVLTAGDYTLFADVPALVPTRDLPASCVFLGPIPWSPKVPRPAALDELGRDRPLVYATLGSSGKVDLLPRVLEALSGLGVDVLVATAGRARRLALPENERATDFVPGDLASRRAALVVSNGGSSTGYQTLAEGTPVLGLPWNLDQYLASEAIDRAGAGLSVRAGTATAEEIREAAARLLTDGSFAEAARRLSAEFLRWSPHRQLDALLACVRESTRPGGAPASGSA
jgi:UDP:flavonoid glycosyltransferase YjiC (YdhE family)